MTDQLRIENIRKQYEGNPLLKGISFEVSTGEVLCLLGQSGSGKSTLLRIIAGIEPAESGRVLWNGHEMDAVPTHLRRFGLMFQDYALFPHLNVRDNVAFGLRIQGMSTAEIDEKVKAALDRVNLGGFGQRRVTDLSGGEQQRVALARALAPGPRLLMLDEPLAALDRALRAQLQEELRSLLHQAGIPAIYVTHDQDEALALGDRLALLHEGEIIQIGSPEEVYRRPHNAWAAEFLGMENIFAGQVVGTAPFSVSTNFGELQATPETTGGFKPGDACRVVLLKMDAEKVSIGRNTVSLTVDESVFKGDHYRTIGHNDVGQTLTVNLWTRTKKDEKITLRLDPGNLYCLKE